MVFTVHIYILMIFFKNQGKINLYLIFYVCRLLPNGIDLYKYLLDNFCVPDSTGGKRLI